MGKNSKTKASKNVQPKKNYTWMVLGGAVFLVGAVWATVHFTRNAAEDAVKAPPALIATLNPENFAGKARAAYQVAKDIPEILNQLPCFCGCKDARAHQSNLYCFSESHGSVCDECQNIALEAQEMHSKGMTVSQIREKIKAAYGDQRM